jgi:hypothetical protein
MSVISGKTASWNAAAGERKDLNSSTHDRNTCMTQQVAVFYSTSNKRVKKTIKKSHLENVFKKSLE